MKTYRVNVTMTTELFADIEAESQEEAEEIADNMDGASFQEYPLSGGWHISSVFEQPTKAKQ